MVNKFLIAIAGVVAVMAALVALPRISPPLEQQQALNIDYIRQNLTRIEDGRLVAASADDLLINNDLTATYRSLVGAPNEKKFAITNQEMNTLKGMILTTGFMQLPGADYSEKDNVANLTKYTLRLESGGSSKTITWVDEQSSEAFVPSLVRNIGFQLDAIIKEQ
jgi:hypothetical protein